MKPSMGTLSSSTVGTMDYISQLDSPFSIKNSSPQASYSPGSRIQEFGKKLAFWKKRPTTARDVCTAVYRLKNSHTQYRKDLTGAHKALSEWNEYLSPPSLASEDLLQLRLVNEDLSQRMGLLLDTMKPVVDMERKLDEVYSAFAHGFSVIKGNEAACKSAIKAMRHADHKYFKSMASQSQNQNQDRLSSERAGVDVIITATNFEKFCKYEIPHRFVQLSDCYQQIGRETSRAHESMKKQLASWVSQISADHEHSQEQDLSSTGGIITPPLLPGDIRSKASYYARSPSNVHSPSTLCRYNAGSSSFHGDDSPSSYSGPSTVDPLCTSPKYSGYSSYHPIAGPESRHNARLSTPLENPQKDESLSHKEDKEEEEEDAQQIHMNFTDEEAVPGMWNT